MSDSRPEAGPQEPLSYEPETIYLGFERGGRWHWRKLTAGAGTDDIRAVYFVRSRDSDDRPEVPERPEPIEGRPGFSTEKPPRESLDDPKSEGNEIETAGGRPLCYWVNGTLYCEQGT